MQGARQCCDTSVWRCSLQTQNPYTLPQLIEHERPERRSTSASLSNECHILQHGVTLNLGHLT